MLFRQYHNANCHVCPNEQGILLPASDTHRRLGIGDRALPCYNPLSELSDTSPTGNSGPAALNNNK